MNRLDIKGCGTALVTPFKNGEVDYEALSRLITRQVTEGIDFLVPLGTSAETPCLNNDEKVIILKMCRQLAPGLCLLVGAGTNSLSGTLKNIDMFEGYGADAYLIVTPYYNKPTQRGLFEYYTAVADYSPKPIVIYNVPGRTGVNISYETTLALAKHPNIAATKEASSNYAQIARIIAGAPEGFQVFSGNDDETLSLIATGASGVISVVSNVIPSQMVALCKAALNGDMASAREMHHTLFAFCKDCFVESNPIPIKEALFQLGLIKNELRLPMTCAEPSTVALINHSLKDLKLI